MREAALKSVIFVGVPRVSLKRKKGVETTKACTCRELIELPCNLDNSVLGGLKRRAGRRRVCCVAEAFDPVRRRPVPQQHEVLAFLACREPNAENIEATIQSGMALWNSIYEPHAAKLHGKLAALHPDFISTYSFPFHPVVLSLPPTDDNPSHRLVYMTCLEFDEY